MKIGGKLKSRKGINVPQLQIDCSALTVKDREDAAYLLSMGVDYIALSFAQKAQDIQELIDLMDAEGIPCAPPHRHPHAHTARQSASPTWPTIVFI